MMNDSEEEKYWSMDDLQTLFSTMKTSIPKRHLDYGYGYGLRKINWTKVAFPPFSAEDCKKKWAEVMSKMRKYRTLTELLTEAEEILSNPALNPKVLPGYPKKARNPNILYFMKNHERLSREHPGLNGLTMMKLSNKNYKFLRKETKAKYMKTHSKEMKEHNKKMMLFRETYNIKSKTPLKPIVDTDDEDSCEDLELDKLPPPPPSTSYYVFCQEQRLDLAEEEGAEKQDLKKLWAQRWKGLSASEKNVYKERCRQLKKKYYNDLESYLNRFTQEERKRILAKKQIKGYDRLNSQKEPKKPPRSGNLCFVQLQMERLKDSFPDSKERFVKSNRMWSELPKDMKKCYNEKAEEGMNKYRTELLAWYKKLSPKEQEAFKKKNPAKMKCIDASVLDMYGTTRPPPPPQASDSEDESLDESSSEEEDGTFLNLNDDEETEEESEREEEEGDIWFEMY